MKSCTVTFLNVMCCDCADFSDDYPGISAITTNLS